MKVTIDKLCYLNKTKKELLEILNPEHGDNLTLFWTKSKNQKRFNDGLYEKGIQLSTKPDDYLEEILFEIEEEFNQIKKKNTDIERTRLDFDFAKIIHSKLTIPKMLYIEYDFWRSITLFYFIEHVRWRWVKGAEEDDTKWLKNAKSVYSRSLGERNARIDLLRYYKLGNRFYCNTRGYHYLDKLAELAKSASVSEGAFQDFINQIEGNVLLSPNNRISKLFADIMILDRNYSGKSVKKYFKRYNAITKRLLSEASKEVFQKEVFSI